MNNYLNTELTSRIRSADFTWLSGILPDPDYILRKKGADVKVYEEILSDPHVTCCVNSRKSGVKSLEWDISKGQSSDEAYKLIEAVFKKININDRISEILNAPLFGFQVSEIIWSTQGKYIIPENIKGRPNNWFVFDEDEKLRFRSKENMITGEDLSQYKYKFLLTQHNAINGNPYGERLLSKCVWPVTFKKGGLQFWLVFVEKFGTPWVIGKAPRQIEEKKKEELLDSLESMVQDGIIVIPEDSSVTLLDSASKAASVAVYKELVNHAEKDISKALLGQTLTTDVGSTGSYAASKTHFDVRQDIIDADKELVENTINTLIQWICDINFGEMQEYPVFQMHKDEGIDKTLAERDQILVNMGVSLSKKYIAKAYNLDDDDFELIPTQTTQNKNDQTKPTPKDSSFSASTVGANLRVRPDKEIQSDFPDQKAIDELINSFTPEDLNKQMDLILKPAVKMVMESSNPDDVLESLSEAYPKMNTDELENILTMAMFISETWGRINGNR